MTLPIFWGGESYDLVLRYRNALFSANEYMIGMLWFLITLFWCSVLMGLFQYMHCVEGVTVIYIVIYIMWQCNFLTLLPNTSWIPFANIFHYMKYVLIGYLVGKYMDFLLNNKIHYLWIAIGMIGLVGYLYDGILFKQRMLDEGIAVVYFQSYWMDLILVWILIEALRHPMSNMDARLGNTLATIASLLFFAQRIALDAIRSCWGIVFQTPCTWGKLYIVTLVLICILGIAVEQMCRNKKIKAMKHWVI